MIIGIYGMGRFGSFWGRHLAEYGRDKGWTVVGYNRSAERPFPPEIRRVDEEELFQADAVVLCAAISSLEEVLRRNGHRVKPGSLVMDTCSVKVRPAELMDRYLPEGTEILGTHPMFGPDSGRNGIAGLPIVVSPVRCASPVLESWKEIFRAMGLRVEEMTPDDHDLEAAFTQGVTHFIGRVLGQLELKPSPMATLGYRELLKIVEQTCNDPFQLFLDLQKQNPHTGEMRRKLKAALEDTLRLMEK